MSARHLPTIGRRSLVVCLLFFASGAAGVVFETLWFHQVRLVLGSSVWASALVPAGFMAGLGVGNAVAMRRGDLVRHPLRAYAALEMVVAVSGVLLVYGLPVLASVFAPTFRPWLDAPAPLAVVRLSTAFLLLLVPSTAMGLTLPLLVRALATSDGSFGRVLGLLYGFNTLGAVAGALISEIYLIGWLGIRGAALVAGALNTLAACVALLLAVRRKSDAIEPRRSAARRGALAAQWRWLVAAFVSGAALLALEVLWIRFLSLYVLTVSLAFAVMLAIVLAGIGVGGLAASQWLRVDTRAHRFLAAVALLAGCLTLVTYAVFPECRQAAGVVVAREGWQVVKLGVPLMFPVSLASGVLFTLLGAALRAESSGNAAAVALLTLFNTAGAALGAVLAGGVLLPSLGMERALFAVAISYAMSAAVLVSRARAERQVRLATVVVGAAFVIAATFFPFGAMQRVHFAAQIARWSADLAPHAEVREGRGETIIYVERQFAGRTRSQRLVTNNISMSSSDVRNRRYMKLFVYWPVAVHPAPKEALLICFGVGATAKALTDTRELENIDVVDVSRDVLEMSRVVYPDPRDNPLRDPRVRVHVEDGRFYLQATDRRYDIITGEPPPPSLDGVATLYSVEYFRLLHDHLRDGGIVTYWLPTHSLTEQNSLAVVRAFCDAFDDCSLWSGFGTDLMLVGTRGARGGVTDARFRAQWDEPRVAQELDALGFEYPEQLGALFMGDASYLHALTAGVLPVVDDFPRRIAAPPFFSSYNDSGLGLYGSWADTASARVRFEKSPLIARLWPSAMRERSLGFFAAQAPLNRFAYRSSLRLSDNLQGIHELLTTTTLRAPVLWMLGTDADVLRIVKTLSPEELAAPSVAYQVAAQKIADRRFEEALPWLDKASVDPAYTSTTRILRVYALFMAGRRLEAEAAAAEARAGLVGDPSSVKLLGWIERTFVGR